MDPILILVNKNNSELISELKDLVAQERQVLAHVLRYLREVEGRRLYLKMGYPSLFEFARQELGYSESSAGRRIQAMRLSKELPIIEKKLETGELTLSVVSQVSSFIRQEDCRRRERKVAQLKTTEKLDLVTQMEGTSIRECEKQLAQLSPEGVKPKEKIRMITEELTLIQFSVGSGLMKKIERLKTLTGYTNSEGKLEKLFEQAVDALLAKVDPVKRSERREKRQVSKQKRLLKSPLPAPVGLGKNQRHIPQAIRDQVWVRDQGQCQFQDKRTGKVCRAKHHLQLDHKFPFSLGGRHTLENLRLLCAQHNRFHAKEVLSYQRSFVSQLSPY